MSNRLSKIVTKTGDKGTTGLGDGSRLGKDHARIEALGAIDELNCSLGLLLACSPIPSDIQTILLRIQQELFELGAEMCIPGSNRIKEAHIEKLEADIGFYNGKLLPLKEFILPGGNIASAQCHMARSICRRAERRLISLSKLGPVFSGSLIYLNRLSDLLFILARSLMRGQEESLWQR